jgi:hypothetical protein
MPGHHQSRGAPRRHPTHLAISAAVAAASVGPGGHRPTLTGAGSTFDEPFFAVAFAQY